MNFSEVIDKLYTRLKAGEAALVDRQSRIKIIDGAIEDYFAEHGKMPEPEHLERLGSLILYEELSGQKNNKMKTQEYPPASDRWVRERHNQERSFKLAEEVGSDRICYRKPTRDNRRKF